MSSRNKMIFELKIFNSMSKGEMNWVAANYRNYASLEELLAAAARRKSEGGACHAARDVVKLQNNLELLRNPTSSLSDNPAWVAWCEQELLGLGVSCSKVDAYNIGDSSMTCRQFLSGEAGFALLGVEIKNLKVFVTKRGKSAGKEMAILEVADSSCEIKDIFVFADHYEEVKTLLTVGNVVLVQLEQDKKRKSYTLKNIYQVKQL